MRAPKVVSSWCSSSPTDTALSVKSNDGAGQTIGPAVVPTTSALGRIALCRRWTLSACGLALAVVMCVVSPVAVAKAQHAVTIANPFEGRTDVIDEGRSLFNQYCAHCHGTNAYQGERPRDLRRLNLRYGQQAPRVIYETVSNGRLDRGMPVWKTVLSDDVLWQIFTFLETVQTPP
jgi:mono/diheme cytochrome c family protein